ncbi:macrolide family glycosyltransferase [Streptomyces iconiensis]|uniref:Glycosyltransferase n=1 Tax=Streptomyces iconiensis TaxID=1384038 RepID=A0ABT7A8T6_9ACTN|nr:macrolide family glycosyltransferase [Streptomyces iconiensis]MDJ1137761.1 glycosyltransferase [Streptomyces iconiensis]
MPPRHESAHIAMFSIAAHGHVRPSLEVIRELVARGHRVTYAIPPSFADLVAETGAEPRLFDSILSSDDDPEVWGTELVDNMEPFLTDAVQALPQLAKAYEGDVPDLVLADITSYPSRVLAHRWGVPHVQLSPNLVAWEGYEADVGDATFAALRSTERGASFLDRFADWIAAQGMEMGVRDFMGHPDRCVVLMTKALQPHADRVNEDVYTFVGSCKPGESGEPAAPEWRRPGGDARVLLVSLGSAFTKEPAFYRACLAAFGGLDGWHLVLQIGKHVDPAELGPLPANAEVHDWVPQLEILRQADAFVTHAGAGSSQEGLATATPMIAVPQAADQFMNAQALADLGVARVVPREEATPEALREALEALTGDPGVAAKAEGIRGRMAAEGGTRRAADLIEAELPRRA